MAAKRGTDGPMRINKYISRAGVTSRRKADDLVREGRVKVNGEVMTEVGTKVEAGDRVEVNGKVIWPDDLVHILVYKDKDTISTTDDPRDRDTILDLITLPEEEKEGLFPVGRLDRNTTGAILVTNDGDLAHRLMHPRYEVEKLYYVRTRENVSPDQLDRLQRGVDLEDGPARADKVAYLRPPAKDELGMQLHEGRNRQIRRMLSALGHDVVHLERVRYAGLTLDGLRRGKWRRLKKPEVEALRRRVGL